LELTDFAKPSFLFVGVSTSGFDFTFSEIAKGKRYAQGHSENKW
jgi:hypothetical protein